MTQCAGISLVTQATYGTNTDSPPGFTLSNKELKKMRPLCGASETINIELNKYVSKVLEAAMECVEVSKVTSLEEK